MKYLLDTHAFIWLDGDEQKLSKKTKIILLNPENLIYLSSASLWEMQIKAQLGKLILTKTIKEICDEQFAFNNILLLDIEIEHIFNLNNLPEIHSDPFDRLIISQAQIENLVILTKDQNIHKYDVKTVWE